MKHLCLLSALLALPSVSFGQLVFDRTFDPNMSGGLCGLAVGDDVWVYDCFGTTLDVYATDGTFVTTWPRPKR